MISIAIVHIVLHLFAATLSVTANESTTINVDSNEISSEHIRNKRLAIHPSQWYTNLWPGGVVPYEIAPHYNEWEKSVILSAMAEFPKHTCISFRPRNQYDRYYLTINKYYNLERCFSFIGRQTSYVFRTPEGNIETRMRLDPSCLRVNGRGTVMHELMHIIGFYHEHQRDDRDPRIRGSRTHYNYKIYPRSTTYYMGPYDPTSLMHYNFPGIVYPRSYFSPSDIYRINTLYRCAEKKPIQSLRKTTSLPRRFSEVGKVPIVDSNDLDTPFLSMVPMNLSKSDLNEINKNGIFRKRIRF
ncbi:astacin [Dictyocaulus viviparus]|uniref:Metalloendopeptidase n=1 Tax=Dictyocaulus viviparus TaxID=29172 RepID=A0A0D8YAE6_DICVI|nr:astacin [Dictyocaulus viviparus]